MVYALTLNALSYLLRFLMQTLSALIQILYKDFSDKTISKMLSPNKIKINFLMICFCHTRK